MYFHGIASPKVGCVTVKALAPCLLCRILVGTVPKATHKMSKKQRLLAKHPCCCFCGGIAQGTTVDHVPPKACFPDGYWPEEFEFPACEKCNYGTARNDLIFGFYSILLDFNEANRSQADIAKLNKLRAAIANRYPEALPNAFDARPIHMVNGLVTPSPVAIGTDTPAAFRHAAASIGQKLTHALYYREMGKAISSQHHFTTGCYQPQNSATTTLTQLLLSCFPIQPLAPDPTSRAMENDSLTSRASKRKRTSLSLRRNLVRA